MAVKIKRERPDQRRHHRVSAPLYVGVDGTRLRATDWSLGGLRLDGYPGDLPSAGSEKQFHLTLPFQGFDVSFDVKAEVVRAGGEGKSVAVRFTEIGERERELMQHFIEELVRGSMSGVEDTIQRIDVPVTPAKLEPDAKNLPANLPMRRWPVKTMVMTGIYGVIGLAIFGYAGLLGYSNFFRMEIQTAVISAPVETVAAQADGQVLWTNLKPGDEVKSGEVVVNVIDNELEREIEIADIAVQEQKAKLAFLKKRHLDELDKVRSFANIDMKNVQQGKVELEGLQEQLKIANHQLASQELLDKKGFATLNKLSEAQTLVATLRSQIEQKRLELTSRIDLAEQSVGKRLFTSNNVLGQSEEIEAQVGLTENEIKLAEERHKSYMKQRDRTAVTAPFSGTILDLPRVNRGSVRKGDTIAIIEQRTNRRVTAFLSQDEIMKVGLGDEALLFVPALGETLKGRVTEVDRTTGFLREQNERVGSGYSWRGAHDRTAKITIDFNDTVKTADAERYRAGLPVVVVFEQRSTNSLLSTIKKKFAVSM